MWTIIHFNNNITNANFIRYFCIKLEAIVMVYHCIRPHTSLSRAKSRYLLRSHFYNFY